MNSSEQGNKKNIERLVDANNRIAVDLLDYIRGSDPGNVFFSPANILQTVAMAFAGARGETERQMSETIAAGLGREETVAAINELNKRMLPDAGGEGAELSVAYATWVKKNLGLHPEYADLVKERMGSAVSELDFEGDPEGAVRIINEWVDKKTNSMIEDVIGTNDIDELTLVILTGAIYFLGKWADEFEPESTGPVNFQMPDRRSMIAATMAMTGDFKYAETEACRALELPYKGTALSMVVIIPKEKKVNAPASEVFGSDGAAGIKSILDRLEYPDCEVSLRLPRFELDTTASLKNALAHMGMPEAFDMEKADFSGMVDFDEFAVSAIIHQARVKVDEQGTEAAAVTMVAMAGLALEEEEIINFHVDRSFAFMIVDRGSGAVLFMGSVVKPEMWEEKEERLLC